MKVGLLVCGPSGVGKSSHISDMLKQAGVSNQKFLILDPDSLDGTHAERSEEALRLVHEAIQDGKQFIYPATCGGIRVVKQILHAMKRNGYKTVVAIVYASLPQSLKRIEQRTDQPVPEEVVRDLHAFFKTKAERYMTMTDIDELYLYNNEEQFSMVLSKKNKVIICRNSQSDFYFDVSKYCGST